MNSSKKIIYIAPMIPSRSATFIYNEIIALEKHDIQIIPISLHPGGLENESEKIQRLIQKTEILYNRNILDVLVSIIALIFQNPLIFIKALCVLVTDTVQHCLHKKNLLKPVFHFSQAAKIAKLALDRDVHHIHAHFATAPLSISRYASLLSNISFSFTTHALDIFAEDNFIDRYSKRAKKVVTISEFNRDFLISKGVPVDKIKVIRCGIDFSTFNFSPKQKLNYPVKIVTLCRLTGKKGVDILLDALKILKDKEVDFCCEIAGSGLLQKKLITQADEIGIDSTTTFIGPIPHHKVPSWLQTADIFVLASKVESNGDKDGIPVALMEAMALGVPVISTKISGIPELIEDDVNGFLASPGDAYSLAEAILKLITNYDLVPEILKSAREKVFLEFNEEKSVECLIEIFKSK